MSGDNDEREKYEALFRGMDAAGATLERAGYVLGKLALGVSVDANNEAREGVVVDPRTQAIAMRLVMDLRGMIRRRLELTADVVARHRIERAQLGSGEIAGIPAAAIRALPVEVREELLTKLEIHGLIELPVVRGPLLGAGTPQVEAEVL